MAKSVHPVLFVCTGNPARSIMAEALLNALGGGRFQGHSAGTDPSGAVHPLALATLAAGGYSTTGLRGRQFDEFLHPDAPPLDFMITVGDATVESLPALPRVAATAHWGVDDPAGVAGTEPEQRRAFQSALVILRRRVQHLTALPLESVDKRALGRALHEIGLA